MGYDNDTPAKGDILIVDDHLPSLNTLSSILTTLGYEVRGVPDGPMALTVVENQPPELVLLDVKMPGMDGFEVCQRIKADKKSSDIPILFLSGLDDVTDKVKGFEAGAVDFIPKPFQAEEVLARVNTHLTLSRLRKKLEQQIDERTAELTESEERYRLVVESSQMSIIVIRDGCILFSNPASARMLGFSDPEEMLGIPVLDSVASELRQLVAERIERLEKEQNNPIGEITLIRQDGRRIIVEFTSVSVPIGGIPTLVFICQDISGRKEREKELQMMKSTVEMAIDPIVWLAPDGRYIYANEASLKESGYSRDKLLSLHTFDIGTDFTPEIWRDHFQEVKRVGSMRFRTEIVTGDGDTTMYDVHSNYAKIEEEEFIFSFGRDITERIHIERKVEEMRRFELLLSDISTSFIDFPLDRADEMINNALEKVGQLLGFDRCSFGSLTLDQKEMIVTHVWHRRPIPSARESYILDQYPWLLSPFKTGIELLWNKSEGLPIGSKAEMRLIEKSGLKSVAGIPVNVVGKLVGCLGFSSVSELVDWNPELVLRLKHLSVIFGNILMQKQSRKILLHERKLLENSEERFRSFMDNNPALAYIKDSEGRHSYANQTLLDTYGISLTEFIGTTSGVFHSPDVLATMEEADEMILSEKTSVKTIEIFTELEGVLRWWEDTKFLLKRPTGEKMVGGIVIDITKRKQAEELLLKSQENFRNLAGKLLNIQETERKRLARELHDDLSQRLAVLAMSMGSLAGPMQGSSEVAEKIQNIQQGLVQISEDVHAISRQLHPSILDDLGLIDAVRSECTAFSRREGIRVNYKHENMSPLISKEVSLSFFRIIQEAFRNISKHAQTKSVSLTLSGGGNDNIRMEIVDQGTGFDLEIARKKHGLGLISIEERVRMINGKLEIMTSPGKGTWIRVTAPGWKPTMTN